MDNPFEILIQQNAEIIQYLQDLKATVLKPSLSQEISTEEDRNLSCAELSDYLKKDISTIHRYRKNGVFPFYQAGRTIFFKKSEVDKALSSLTAPGRNKKGVKAHG